MTPKSPPMQPEEIEALSFRIIEAEAGDHGIAPQLWPVVRRMIHTSADFEYIDTVRCHPQAITAGIEAIRNGRLLITDTQMASAGIRKKNLERFGARVICRIDDPKVIEQAQNKKQTRARAAVMLSINQMTDGIYVVGNAPTALLALIEAIQSHHAKPALIIGFPVGFVNAVESKAALLELDIPYITNEGRKGGSNIAAAVVNALILMAMEAKD